MPSTDTNAQRKRIKILHEQIFTLIWFALRRLVQRLQSYGLTHPQFITLVSLANHPEAATMSQLAQVTFQDAPTMTGIVNRLVKMELVCRARSEEDRRIVWVETTPEGKTLVQQIEIDLEQEDPYGFLDLDEAEINKMEEILDYILKHHVKDIYRQDMPDAETSRQALRGFASDPIGFIKKQDKRGTKAPR